MDSLKSTKINMLQKLFLTESSTKNTNTKQEEEGDHKDQQQYSVS
jgi:hypothetical protein